MGVGSFKLPLGWFGQCADFCLQGLGGWLGKRCAQQSGTPYGWFSGCLKLCAWRSWQASVNFKTSGINARPTGL